MELVMLSNDLQGFRNKYKQLALVIVQQTVKIHKIKASLNHFYGHFDLSVRLRST